MSRPLPRRSRTPSPAAEGDSPPYDAGVSQGSATVGEAVVWIGEVTWREVAGLREELFDQMDARPDGVILDVRRVTVIDRTGLALLIGANHRARSMGRPLTLVDDRGPVTAALAAASVVADFAIALHLLASGVTLDGAPALPSGERATVTPGSSPESADPPLGARSVDGVAEPDRSEPDLSEWTVARHRYLDALWQGEHSTATAIALNLLARGASAERIISDLLAEAQAVVGREWQLGRWSIAGEHLATAISESVLHDLSRAATNAADTPVLGSRGQTAVVCGEGEWHTLPALMATTVLRLRGVHVTYVAPSLPAEDLVEYLLHDGPTVVAVTCSSAINLVGAWRSISALRAGGMTIVCAGRGFGTDGRWGWALGADQWAPDLIRGADRILTAIDSRPHPPRAPLARAGIAQEMHFLRRERDQLLLDAVRAASTARPRLVQTDAAHRATRDRVEAILDVVAAAAIVGDPAVATEHVTWLETGLRARSQPLDWAAAAFAAVLEVLPGELVNTRAMTLTGLAACGRIPLPPEDNRGEWVPPGSRHA